MAYNFDDLADVLADDSDDEEEEEQSNELFEDLDDVLDEDGNLVEPDTNGTDDDPEPLTRSSGNGDHIDCGSTEGTGIKPHGVDHGYSAGGQANDDDETIKDNNGDMPEELVRSKGNGDSMDSDITVDDELLSHGVDHGYGEDGIIDQEECSDEQDDQDE